MRYVVLMEQLGSWELAFIVPTDRQTMTTTDKHVITSPLAHARGDCSYVCHSASKKVYTVVHLLTKYKPPNRKTCLHWGHTKIKESWDCSAWLYFLYVSQLTENTYLWGHTKVKESWDCSTWLYFLYISQVTENTLIWGVVGGILT